MDELLLEEMKPLLESSTRRTMELIDAVVSNVKINWDTGEVDVPNAQAFTRAITDVRGDDAAPLALDLLATLGDGFAVRPGVQMDDDSFRFLPWRSLFETPSLAALDIADWKWLGLAATSDPSAVREALQIFPHRPDYVGKRAYVSRLSESAGFYLGDTTPIPLGDAKGSVRQPLGDPGPTPPPTPPQQPPGPDYAKLAAEIWAFIKEIGDCFAGAQWSIQTTGWPFFYPLGPRVCLDPPCAKKVADALKGLLGASVGNLITTLGVLIAKGLLTWAAIGSALGWVGLAILHFAAYWTPMILLNTTPRGVCITHLFPWNVALTAGIVSGWAVGR